MIVCSREISAWLCAGPGNIGRRRSGVSARGGGRAETLQLDLVRTGIENDFEKVVFPQYPELSRGEEFARTGWGAVCIALRIRFGGLWIVRVARKSRGGCEEVEQSRHSGGGDNYLDAAAVLETASSD